mmetsp:Transcript_23175/g.33241  ORF Transcript_23175/g.33241 Transcript_23175/m.33241 type:complete len:611 (+) Transcript_23175:243-2075(+)|eukprot:CAMPEP_0172419754 /NCGR_PEP_ID=MMETSP1064-20121228/6146_1 /TAXON_ID=202472 /ORGANISM="Aulacoseira subarctica , Strain CCAP 1002/5" /LENGTH=610 /DNA_ID=CAMNT_0013159369 /DNA_START=169 /DNA_END=2001 /DNA_ORIENTATION=-
MAKEKSQVDEKNKKYKLFSAARLDDPNIKPVCAFFQSSAGCRNGANCKFAHTATHEKSAHVVVSKIVPKNLAMIPSSAASISTSIVSSESSDSSVELKQQKVKTVVLEMGKKAGKKRKTTENLAAGTQKNAVAPQVKKRKEGGLVEDGNPFALVTDGAKKTKSEQVSEENSTPHFRALASQLPITPASTTAPLTTNNNSTKIKKQKKQQQPEPPQTDFRSLVGSLPVAAFSMDTTGTPSKEKETAAKSESSEEEEEESDDENPGQDGDLCDNATETSTLPSNHPDGVKWKDLIIKSRLHPRYVKVSGREDEGWIKPKRYGPWCAQFPQAIAIDCEMCETKDPSSGKINGKALCRFSVVNAMNPSEVLIDTLVKPEWPVTNYRSWINGIDKSHLENVQFTLKHAQDFMKALCSDETVILGHALHNDLEAIKMEHHCLVDSSFLFPVTDADNRHNVCSLRDLANQVLQKSMPPKHDSVNDARTALEAIEFYLEKKGKVEPVERRPKQPDAMKLLVHRIPKGGIVSEAHIENMFLHLTSVKPSSVETIEYIGGFGKTLVSFNTPAHANLSFLTLAGEVEVDKGNFSQKKVFLKNKDYVRVRKMTQNRRLSTAT